jgi:FeS assembly SUF system protein
MSENTTAAEKIMSNVLSLGEDASNEASTPVASDAAPVGNIRDEIIKDQVVETLQTIFDPEIPVNIYELGLIYDIAVQDGSVWVKMTLTSPACPVAGTLPIEVENKIASVPGVKNVEVELVWEPPYSMDMMSEGARLQLGLLW